MAAPVALIYLMAIAVRYSYEFVPDRAHIGLSPDYMIAFLCCCSWRQPRIGWPNALFGRPGWRSVSARSGAAAASRRCPRHHGPGGFCGSRRRAEVDRRLFLPGPGGGPFDRRSIACEQGSFVTALVLLGKGIGRPPVLRRCSIRGVGEPRRRHRTGDRPPIDSARFGKPSFALRCARPARRSPAEALPAFVHAQGQASLPCNAGKCSPGQSLINSSGRHFRHRRRSISCSRSGSGFSLL